LKVNKFTKVKSAVVKIAFFITVNFEKFEIEFVLRLFSLFVDTKVGRPKADFHERAQG
jgi:hypothetical protein